jgi:serine/threonine protein kinase
MARVVLATLRGAGGFEKKLVVKQIRDELAFDDDFTRRFVEEAKTTVALSHPNIVPVYELGVEQGVYFLAMELVEGASLAELIGKGQRLSPDEGAYVGVEVCRALDYAHRKMQVVHRDITPRNVMIDEEGQVKIIDFGIAGRVLDLGVGNARVFGSPGHMPPEQMRGDPIGPAADVFAVAALLLEAWSGKAPFRKKKIEDVEAALARPHPKPSDADARLVPIDDVIARSLALDPNARPQHAEELGRALRKFLMGSDTGDLARSLGERVRALRAKEEGERERERDAGDTGKQRPISSADLETKTFAVRDEAKKWSEPPASDDDAGPSTRKLESGSSAPPKAQDAPIETLATRPIETPVDKPKPRAPVASASRTRWTAPLVAVIAIASVATYVARKGDDAHPTVRPITSTGPLPLATIVVPITSASEAPAPSTARSAASPLVATSAQAPKQAHLALYGDVGTRVRVDGSAWSSCPVKDLAIDPGEHDVRFFFDPTGESGGKRVTLREGDHATVRADFMSAEPTITVTR